jgi:membrane fusion protein (multidrug efflux system)
LIRQFKLTHLVVVTLSVLAWTGCTPPVEVEKVEFRSPVAVRDVGTGDVEDRIVVTGSLRARETVSLRAETPGSLMTHVGQNGRRLTEGLKVSAGDMIAEITGEDVRLAAQTEATYQAYQTALRMFSQKEELYTQGLISELEYRPAVSSLAEAKLAWERSLLTENRSRLVTPIDGVILWLARDESGRPIADGQLVAAGFEVARIAPTDELIADIDLVGPDLSRIEAGQRARLRHHAWDNELFEGRVTHISPVLDPLTRTLRAEVTVNNKAGQLRPGMFIEVTVIAERREAVVVVPRAALTERGIKKIVFVVDGQRVAEREVTLGLGDDEIVEISSGLAEGERIVIRGHETLTDGARVRITGA